MVRGKFDVIGADMARVHEIGGISDHGPVYSQSLVMSPPPGALRLVEAAGEPL